MDVGAMLRTSNHDVERCLYCGSRHLQGTESSTLGRRAFRGKDKQLERKRRGDKSCKGKCVHWTRDMDDLGRSVTIFLTLEVK